MPMLWNITSISTWLVNKSVLVVGEPFQPSLILLGETRSQPSGSPLKQASPLPTNTRLEWKCLQWKHSSLLLENFNLKARIYPNLIFAGKKKKQAQALLLFKSANWKFYNIGLGLAVPYLEKMIIDKMSLAQKSERARTNHFFKALSSAPLFFSDRLASVPGKDRSFTCQAHLAAAGLARLPVEIWRARSFSLCVWQTSICRQCYRNFIFFDTDKEVKYARAFVP